MLSGTSPPFSETVEAGPDGRLAITDVTNNLGSTLNFSVAAISTNAAPLAYQWQHDGTNLSDGGNVSGFVDQQLNADNTGVVQCRLLFGAGGQFDDHRGRHHHGGRADRPVARFKSQTQPKSLSVLAGSTVELSVTATGSPAPTYQWFQNNKVLLDLTNRISGSTSNVLTINLVTTNDAGTYSVLVSNDHSSTNSKPAILTVTPDTQRPGLEITSPRPASDGATARSSSKAPPATMSA